MIRIVIADDHTIVREGLKQLLAAAGDLTVVARGDERRRGASQRVRELDFDVLLLDMSMPGKSGIELIKQVKAEKPKLRILVLSMHEEEQYAVRAIKAGAVGLPDEGKRLRAAGRGDPQGRGGRRLHHRRGGRAARARRDGRTRRARATRRCRTANSRSSGCWPAATASPTSPTRLNLSVKTVSTHKAHILQKMNMTNQAEADPLRDQQPSRRRSRPVLLRRH